MLATISSTKVTWRNIHERGVTLGSTGIPQNVKWHRMGRPKFFKSQT